MMTQAERTLLDEVIMLSKKVELEEDSHEADRGLYEGTQAALHEAQEKIEMLERELSKHTTGKEYTAIMDGINKNMKWNKD